MWLFYFFLQILLLFICQIELNMEMIKLWFIHMVEYYVAFKMFAIGNAYKWTKHKVFIVQSNYTWENRD